MNKRNSSKLIICLLTVILLSPVDTVKSDPPPDTENTASETIGKQNPFEVVRPIAEIKRNLLGSNGSSIGAVVGAESPLAVRSIMLKFLRAENVESAVRGLLSSSGVVTTDKDTNSLIICDTPERLNRIIAEIQEADRTPKQILVEVVIVDVLLDDDTEIGVDWSHLYDPPHNVNYEQSVIPVTSTTGGFFNLIQNGISTTIHALQQTRNVEILASPRVLVVSGQEATLETTEEIPYIELSQSSGGIGGSEYLTSTKFKDAGIKLRVKATITDENKILMTVEPEQSVNTGVAGVGDSDVPIVDKRTITTTLLMEDGQSVVIGGLRRSDTRVTADKIPLLGDLPWIGFLFSNDKIVVQKSELLIFVSPHIYLDEPLNEFEQQRFDELRNNDHPSIKVPNRLEFNLLSEWLTIPY